MKTCPVSKACGGCNQDKNYEATLDDKQKIVEKHLSEMCKVERILGAQDPYYYRNKVHAAFGKINSKVVCGTYAPGSHKIIENSECLIENRLASAIILTIKKLAVSFKTPIFDERKGDGILRRVLVRVGEGTGEVMVVIVVAQVDFPGKKAFVKELISRHKEITTVVFNLNNKRDSMILGLKSISAYGKGYIIERICGKSFKLSPESFCQINHAQTEVLYGKAVEFASLSGNERILDAYCGIGTIGLIASDKAKSLVGIELNGKAVVDATSNAKYNGVGNASFRKGDASELMLAASLKGERFDVVFLDPPRAGTTPEFVNACKSVAPEQIVYISCSVETLARDLNLFKKAGFMPQVAQPVDMFPWTEHVEAAILMTYCGLDKE